MSGTSATIGSVAADVELKLPADSAYASVLRTLAAGLAARLDFTMEDIEDLRMAVSEAASMVLAEADTDAEMLCRFGLEPSQLTLVVSTTAAAPATPDYDGFGWQVLTTLAADAQVEAVPGRYAVTLVVRSSIETAPES